MKFPLMAILFPFIEILCFCVFCVLCFCVFLKISRINHFENGNNPEIKEAVRYIVEAREKSPENVTGKKRNSNEQKNLEDFFETQSLSQEKKANIEISLIKLFVCCGLSWRLIEHPFFIDFVKQLHPSYDPPNRKTLSGSLLDDEILRVNTKVYRLLEKESNLTLGK